MLCQEIKMDLVSNNLANVNTNGYKGDTSALKSFPQMLVHRLNDTYLKVSGVEGNMDVRPMIGLSTFGATVDEIAVDFQKGSLLKTDNAFDMALDSPGFFTVLTPFGERLTRDGAFTLNANGELVNMQGYHVMGQNGPIVIEGTSFEVSEVGEVYTRTEDGQVYVDTLKIQNVDDLKTVRKVGHNLFMVPVSLDEDAQPYIMQPEDGYKLRQGVQERSNVNAVTMLRNMIDIMRTYEANSKMIATEDSLMGRTVNDIARMG